MREEVGKEKIDASLGLAFSLAVFERYRRNGVLQAELRHVPGIRGRVKGVLYLVEGKVVSCYLEHLSGQRQPANMDMLVQLDSKRGPFEWTLTSLPAPPQPPALKDLYDVSPHSSLDSPIPIRIASLELEKLEGWTHRQKMMLSIVFDVVDGRRTVEAILKDTPLPPSVVEEALRILLAMKVIVIPS